MSEDLARLADRTLWQCETILATPYWRIEPFWAAEAIFISLMINLTDGLSSLHKLGSRVGFSDDIPEGDVTDLVHQIRNAVCHIGSFHRRIGQSELSFMRAEGQGLVAQVGDTALVNPYEDDVAFFYGRQRIFAERHIRRATSDARARLRKLAVANQWHLPFDRARRF